MDLGSIGNITFDLTLLYSLVSIVIIDLILVGDNAVVIAMVVRSRSRKKKRRIGLLKTCRYGANCIIENELH